MTYRKKHSRGFTLVELMVVLTVEANRRHATAGSLRTDKLVDIQNYYSYTLYTWRRPSQEDLRRAEEYFAATEPA